MACRQQKKFGGQMNFFCLVFRGSQTALGKFKCLPSAVEIHSANSFFAECLISCTRQKASLPSAICLPCVFRGAHGNQIVCRVPVKMLSAKLWALSKLAVSGSEYQCCSVLNLLCINLGRQTPRVRGLDEQNIDPSTYFALQSR